LIKLQKKVINTAFDTKRIFEIASEEEFQPLAFELFRYQHKYNPVYRLFCDNLHINPQKEVHYSQIPCLPIEFFKTHQIKVSGNNETHIFRSSGTTLQQRSMHYVHSLELYKESILKSFNIFYGNPKDFIFIALVPDFSSHQDSSLAFMMDLLITESAQPKSGFYLNNTQELVSLLSNHPGRKIILLGVTYALLDFAEKYNIPLTNTIIIETGGMKGRRNELTRGEIHEILYKSFQTQIHSEYSMAELMSQAYMIEENLFTVPPWMRVVTREINDPMSITNEGQVGGINIIDLANAYSCPFIATKDLGKLKNSTQFEVLGRFDHSDLRGCNLLVC
jgi:phenylacetate-coenzyme A ligase PaaK-like adenylate-forming protein